MIFYVHKRPENMGADIAHFFANALPYCMLLYGISNFFWLRAISNSNEVGIVSICTCVVYLILPFRVILDKCGRTKWRSNVYYSDFRLVLTSDYDRQNPVTKTQAEQKYLDDL
jgi:hypothetical protein